MKAPIKKDNRRTTGVENDKQKLIEIKRIGQQQCAPIMLMDQF